MTKNGNEEVKKDSGKDKLDRARNSVIRNEYAIQALGDWTNTKREELNNYISRMDNTSLEGYVT